LKKNYSRAYLTLGMALEAKGQTDAALEAYGHALAMNPHDRRALPAYGYLLGVLGRKDEARDVLRRLAALNSDVRNCAFQIAVVYTGLGEYQTALDWMERAWRTHQAHVPFAAVEYRLRPLRKFPRFHDLLGRAGVRPVGS
jgi:tetratricopeptide (TPR) repeat protein